MVLVLEQLQDAFGVLANRCDVAEHLLRRSVLRHPLDPPLPINSTTARRATFGQQYGANNGPPTISSFFISHAPLRSDLSGNVPTQAEHYAHRLMPEICSRSEHARTPAVDHSHALLATIAAAA